MRALAAATVAVLAVDLVPEAVMGQKRQIAQRAILRFLGPTANPLDIGGELIEERLLPLDRELQPALTEVIAPALRQHGGDFLRQTFQQKRDVFMDKLLLECNRERADESFSRPAMHQIGDGNQIREALADTGPGFDG